ncbi:DUF1932 domain-containing protein [Shouchella xiaoxiensis]|uniref:DUF1932 domain-containing protein n=1 Tax=Shouchella xiaoxiensis TaxID=766895 RepID=UPI003F5ABD85
MIGLKISFVGFGEASYELSRGLKAEGIESIQAYDVMREHPEAGKQIEERAQRAGVELKRQLGDVLINPDVLFVAVPASKTIEVSESIQAQLQNKQVLYIDVSASTPRVKQEIEKNLTARHVKFVDAAMLGPLPVYQHKVPISASGTGADLFIEKMKPYQMNITRVGEKAGDASAVKLIRSVFMKGIVGLYLETLQAAETFDVSTEVIDSLEETMDSHSFKDTLNRLVTGSAVHAKRRAFELQGSIDMLQEAGMDATLTAAAKAKLDELAQVASFEQGRETPSSWQDVLAYYKTE